MEHRPVEPFGGEVPATVKLGVTPLTSVLVQIRFPEVISIGREEIIGAFQERIRKQYPISDHAKGLIVVIGGEGPQQLESKTWRFLDPDQEWRVTLATEFVSLETRNYQSRADFCDRIEQLCSALEETIDPAWMHRIGVRYINRLHGQMFENRADFVRKDMFGPFANEHEPVIERTLNQVNATTEEGQMIARWGFLPKSHTHEAELMPAIATDSWYLDVDSYWNAEKPVPVVPEEIARRSGALAGRAYTFFRWATKPALIEACGGKP